MKPLAGNESVACGGGVDAVGGIVAGAMCLCRVQQQLSKGNEDGAVLFRKFLYDLASCTDFCVPSVEFQKNIIAEGNVRPLIHRKNGKK